MRKFRIIGLVVALAVLVSVSKSFAADKIGYIQTAKILSTFEKAKRYSAELESKASLAKAELEKKVAEIKKMEDGLALLQDKEKEKKQLDIEAKIGELNNFKAAKDRELQSESNSKMKDMAKDIDAAMQKFAKDNGYTIIFEENAVFFIDKQYDVTDKFSEFLNKQGSVSIPAK
jgi:outer membrane protein